MRVIVTEKVERRGQRPVEAGERGKLVSTSGATTTVRLDGGEMVSLPFGTWRVELAADRVAAAA
jgi:hypothetical protein